MSTIMETAVLCYQSDVDQLFRGKQNIEKIYPLSPDAKTDVTMLTLIQFDEDNFNSLPERIEVANKAKSIYTNAFAAYDEMEIII